MTDSPDAYLQEQDVQRYLSRETLAADSPAMVTKVIEDIRFLRDRIERIKKLHTPNSTVLKTYESMLASREAVLLWLRENTEQTTLETEQKIAANS